MLMDAMTIHTQETISATKTAVFRLRDPSARKAAMLLDAMKRTHLATEAVITALLTEFETIRGFSKSVKSKSRENGGKVERTAFMQRVAYATLRAWNLPGAGAASARVDAIGMVESYLQQLGDGRETASPPTVPPLSGRQALYEEALDHLAETHANVERESAWRDELNRMARTGSPRPLSLHGYRHFYMLLRHAETGRLYAWVNLLTKSGRLTPTQREANAAGAAGDMIEITTGEVIRCKRPCWTLFPLDFSFDFHDRRFLLSGEPGGGRVVYRPDEDRFELHASFTYESPAVDTGRRFLGVDRGIYNIAAWSVTDEHGRVLEDGLISGMKLRFVQRTLERRIKREQKRRGHVSITARRAQSDEAVHTTANELVAIAKRHGARIVIEELTMQRRLKALPVGNKGGRGGRNFRRILGRQQYAKLVQVLTYKLARVGLPPPIAIGAAYTSQTCPECGHVDKANRPKLKVEGSDVLDVSRFACVKCNHKADADKNAAHIISIKGAWLTQLPTKKERNGRDLREDENFAHYLLDAVRRRGLSGR